MTRPEWRRGAPPRLLIVAPHFAEVALRMAQAMTRHARVQVLVEHGNLSAECGDAAAGLAPDATIRTVSGGRRLSWLWALTRALIAFRPSVVQVEETTSRAGAALVRLARLRAPVAVRVHDVDTHSGRDSALSDDRLRAREWVRRHADLILVHGRHSRELFTRRYSTPTVETEHGVISVAVPADRRAPEPGHILMFGRMEAYKGLDTLTAAIALLQARGVSVRVTVAGRGPELERLRSVLASLGSVTVRDGFVPAADVPGLFQAAEIVVLPYHDATQSGVAAAAFGNGRVVVASAVGGLPDIVGDGVSGLLVSPGDAAALADALTRPGADPALAVRLRAGAERVAAERLNWNLIADRLAPTLLALRSRSRGP